MEVDPTLRLAHGYRVASVPPIKGREVEVGAGADLVIERVEHVADAEPTDVEVLSYRFDEERWVVATEAADGRVVVDFSGRFRFGIRAAEGLISMEVTDGEDAGFAAVLLEGWVMAMTLMLRGHAVFHASAVEHGGSAIALLANSGMGKSTVAALLCRDGAALVSDDVLRVDRCADGFEVFSGSAQIRLRPAAFGLAEQVPNAGVEAAADGRVALRCAPTATSPVPLAAVLIPRPSRSESEARVEWLDPRIAAFELNAYPRVYDWKVQRPIRNHFDVAADIAASVPVGVLVVPWGPPWHNGLLDRIASAVGERQ